MEYTYANLKPQYIQFLQSRGFTHFTTLTYDSGKRTSEPSISSSRRHVRTLLQHISFPYASYFRRGCLESFFSWEAGKNTGRTHAHGLLRFGKYDESQAGRLIYEYWYPRFGACKTEKIRSKGALWYVAKYMLKDQNEDTYEFFKQV